MIIKQTYETDGGAAEGFPLTFRARRGAIKCLSK